MGDIKIYAPGSGGVNIDTDPFLLDEAELQIAENCYHDSTQAHGGALRKRLGLAKFNLIAAGSAILGGITMAIVGTGGAPQPIGNGATGDDSGAGDGTGSAGGTFDGGTSALYDPSAALFGGGSLFAGARLIAIGRGNNTSSQASHGNSWYVTSKSAADAAVIATTPGPPGTIWVDPPTAVFPDAFGLPMVFDAAGKYLYYAASHDESTSAVPTIRKTNGASDVLLATITASTEVVGGATVTHKSAILGMHLGYDDNIYVTVKDKADGETVSGHALSGNKGRVFRLNKNTGALTALPLYTSVMIPYCVTYFNGSVFWGSFNLVAQEVTAATVSAELHGTSTDFLTGSFDHGFTGTGGGVVSSVLTFPSGGSANQCLFVGTGFNGAGYPYVIKRDRAAVGSGTWVASLNASGTSAHAGNCIQSMVEFNSKIYASFRNPGENTKIYQFAPTFSNLAADGHWDGTGTWTTVATLSNLAYNLFVDDGVIYAIGGKPLGSIAAYTSADGTSWTDRSANILDTPNSCGPLPIFMGLDQ